MPLRYTATRRMALIITNNLTHGFVVGSILAGILLVACALLFWAFEAGPNPAVDGVGDGFLWVTRTLLQQEPPYEPATGVGTFLYYVVVITGVGMIALATAAIASKLIELVMRKDSGMGRAKYEDHIVICGWSAKGDEILRELHAPDVLDKRPVSIVAPLPNNPSDDDLTTFIRGVPSDADALRRSGIEKAETAIVLADRSNPGSTPDERDAMTLLTALAVESINPNVHTCVEVIRSENLPHFARAKVDEVVVSAELAGNVLAASAMTHGISGVIADLTGQASGSEFYSAVAPADLAGKSFREALDLVKGRSDALLVGVASNGYRYEVNPPADRRIEGGDRLLMIAESDPTPSLER